MMLELSDVECINCGVIYKSIQSTFHARVGRQKQYKEGKVWYKGLDEIWLCRACSKLHPVIDLNKIIWKLGYKITKRKKWMRKL